MSDMTSLASYTEMKDSGIHWMGIIPKHWDIQKAKFHFTQTNTRGNGTPILLAASQKYGVCPQSWLEGVVQISENTDLQQFKTVHKNDFVISLRSFQGGFERSDFEGVCSPAYQVFHADDLFNNDYLKYLFKNELFIDEMNSLTVGIREGRNIKYDDFANSLIFIPPLNEQSTIAAYLDNQCAKIDEIIAEVQAGIEDYKQWKAAIIYEAVTKGLDPNVKMKDSGVEWIGKIPNNWGVLRLKYVITFIESGVSVNASQSAAENGKIGVLKTSSVSKYCFDPEENKEVNLDELDRVSCPVMENTIIVSRMNTPELVGACGYVEHDYPNLFLPDRLWQVHFCDSVVAKYIWYYLSSNYIRNYYSSLSSGTSSSMQNISKGQFENAQLILPPPEMQSNIVAFLDKKCSALDDLINEKKSLIADLESYKKSLIYEVVTGKKRVR